MATFVRKLTFRSHDLGVNADLILTFDSGDIPGIYKDYYPSAWKVSTFGKTGDHYLPVTYKSQLAFTKAIVSSGIIQPASTFKAIGVGQKTTLTKDGGVYNFSDPVTDPAVPKTNIECENGVNLKEDIGVGFIKNPGDLPDTALVWEGVGSGYSLPVEFTPVLRGYIATNYKENAVLRGQIKTPVLFKENLAKLKEDTTWNITYDDASGKFSIEQV